MTAKKPIARRNGYEAPKVAVYGTMSVLTAAGSKGGNESGAAMNDPLLMA